MDYRQFERDNEQCKPKHFGPPTALQRRLSYDAAHRQPADSPEQGIFRRLVAWMRARARR
jgi:hypothetical protein